MPPKTSSATSTMVIRTGCLMEVSESHMIPLFPSLSRRRNSQQLNALVLCSAPRRLVLVRPRLTGRLPEQDTESLRDGQEFLLRQALEQLFQNRDICFIETHGHIL